MTDVDNVRSSSGGPALIVPGVILSVLGLGGVITYIVLALTETPGDDTGQGALQGALIWVSALLAGVGLVMLFTGIIKTRRAQAGTQRPSHSAEPRSMRDQ